MAIKVLRGNVTPGYKVTAGQTIYGGLGVQLSADGESIEVGGAEPIGLAVESNVYFPAQASQPDNTIGDGFDYPNYNRGGRICVVNLGAEVELFDDKRAAAGASHPVLTSDTFTPNAIVYADATTGKITTTAGSNKRVGRVSNVGGTGASLVLKIVVEI